MSFSPYLGFAGTARAAMTRYAEIFGATDLAIMEFSDAPPDQRPPGTEGLVMHAYVSTGTGMPLMGCDIPEGYGPGGMGASSVYHDAPTAARAAEIVAALAEGGTLTMPLEKTFWSSAFGMVTDRWGTRWMISVAEPAQR